MGTGLNHTHKHSHAARVDEHIDETRAKFSTGGHSHGHTADIWQTSSTDHEHSHAHADVSVVAVTTTTYDHIAKQTITVPTGRFKHVAG